MRIPFLSAAIDRQHAINLSRDLAIIVLSILLAVILVKTGTVDWVITSLGEWQILTIFLAGLFFTSMFTSPPAMVILGDLALHQPIWLVAGLGAAGAAVGDFFIYRFVKDTLAGDLKYLLSLAPRVRWPAIFHSHAFKWLPPFLGAIIIASPLPDELGVVILGLSKAPRSIFIMMSYSLNFMGIAIVGWIARAL